MLLTLAFARLPQLIRARCEELMPDHPDERYRAEYRQVVLSEQVKLQHHVYERDNEDRQQSGGDDPTGW